MLVTAERSGFDIIERKWINQAGSDDNNNSTQREKNVNKHSHWDLQ